MDFSDDLAETFEETTWPDSLAVICRFYAGPGGARERKPERRIKHSNHYH